MLEHVAVVAKRHAPAVVSLLPYASLPGVVGLDRQQLLIRLGWWAADTWEAADIAPVCLAAPLVGRLDHGRAPATRPNHHGIQGQAGDDSQGLHEHRAGLWLPPGSLGPACSFWPLLALGEGVACCGVGLLGFALH